MASGKRIVVIDDDVALVAVYVYWLGDLGYEAAVPSGPDMWISPHTYVGAHAALIDLNLKTSISGIDICRWLALNQPEVLRVIITGSVNSFDDVEALTTMGTAGDGRLAHFVLGKPFSQSSLLAALEWGNKA